MGKDTTAQARAETVAKAAVDAADSLKSHAERAAHAAQRAAATGIQSTRHGTAHAADRITEAAGPVREAALRAAEHSRETAEALVARAGDSGGGDRRSWAAPAAVAVVCAAGVGFLVWWLARTPRDGTVDVLSVQPVPPA